MTDEKQKREDFAHRVRCVFLIFGASVDDVGVCTNLSAVIESEGHCYLRVDVSKWAWESNTNKASDNLYCYCNMVISSKNGCSEQSRLTLRESMSFSDLTALVYDFLATFNSFKPPIYDAETLSTMAILTHLGGVCNEIRLP